MTTFARWISQVIRGDWNIMKWLRSIDCECDEGTFLQAVKCGDLNIMKWFKKERCPWDETIFTAAARRGVLQKFSVAAIEWMSLEQGHFYRCFKRWRLSCYFTMDA